jgi:hypothetical protein
VPSVDVKKILALLVAAFVAVVVVGPGTLPAVASPYPVTSGTDPTDPANCPGGYGVGSDGAVAWCRYKGVMVSPSSGVGPRWAGSYAILVDGQVFYGWCLNDAGTHPRVAYPVGTMEDGQQLVADLYGGPAHPDAVGAIPVAMGLVGDGAFAQDITVPGSGKAYSADVLSAAVWAIQHYVVGDRSTSGRVVVPRLQNWSGNGLVDQATVELFAYADGQQNFTMTITHDAVAADGTVTFRVAETSDAGPLAPGINDVVIDGATNLAWRTAGPLAAGTVVTSGSGTPDTVVTDGSIELQMRLVDRTRPGHLDVSRRWAESKSWQGFPVGGGQQHSGVYMSPYQLNHTAGDDAQPVAVPMRVAKTFDNPAYVGRLAGYSFAVTRRSDAALVGEFTTDASGVTPTFPVIAAEEYCITETVDADPRRVAIGEPMCLIASAELPPMVVSFTNHVRPAQVHGVKVDDRGNPVAGATFRLDCGSASASASTSRVSATSAADGAWAFADVAMSSGPVPAACTVTETTASPGMVATTVPLSFVLDAGDDLDLADRPVVNRWDRQFASMTSTPVALPGSDVAEFAFARNLSAGEQVTITGEAFWLGDGDPVPTVPTTDEAAVSFGPWHLTGSGTAEVRSAGQPWTLPADRSCGGYQVVLSFTSADGSVVGTEGWGNPDQYVAVPCVRTVSPKVLAAGDAISDEGVVGGVPAASDRLAVSSVVSLPLVRHRGNCVDAEDVASASVAVPGNGPFTSETVATVEAGFAYTFTEALTVTVVRSNRPDGWTTRLPEVDGEQSTYAVTTTPERCNPDETTFVPTGSTVISATIIAAGSSISDALRFTGLPQGTAERPVSIDGGFVTWGNWRFAAVASGGLFRWPAEGQPDCSGSPVAEVTPTSLTENGTSTGLGTYTATTADAGMLLGYVETITVTATNVLTGATEEVTVTGECGDADETGVSPMAPPEQPATRETPARTPQPIVALPTVRRLPRTGGVAELPGYLGTALLVGGVGLVGTVRRRQRTQRRRWSERQK